jgi:hypothetical protein
VRRPTDRALKNRSDRVAICGRNAIWIDASGESFTADWYVADSLEAKSSHMGVIPADQIVVAKADTAGERL